MKTKLLFPLALLLIGCGNVPSSSETSTSSSESFSLEEGEVFAYVREGKAHITWNFPDHSLFRVYGSDTKYGTYQLLTEKNGIRGSSFSTPSYRYGYFKVSAYEDGKDIFLGKVVSPLGDNALVIEENDDLAKVQEEIDERHSHLETADEGQALIGQPECFTVTGTGAAPIQGFLISRRFRTVEGHVDNCVLTVAVDCGDDR